MIYYLLHAKNNVINCRNSHYFRNHKNYKHTWKTDAYFKEEEKQLL